MTTWHKLNDNYETKYECGGKVAVIRPTLHRLVVPLFCPVCKFPMANSDDAAAYREGECCYQCDLHWRRPYMEQWLTGWRPSEDSLAAYIERRAVLSRPVIKFK